MSGWPTCRRYPRTLADAFPAVRAVAIEHHRNPWAWLPTALNWLLALAIGAGLSALLLHYWMRGW